MTREIAARLRSAGRATRAVPLDVTDEGSVIAAYDAAEAELGTVDTLIANAGVSAADRSADVQAD